MTRCSFYYRNALSSFIAIGALALSAGGSAAQAPPLSAPPEQLAAAITRTMTDTTSTSPAGLITVHYSSHGSIIESHMQISDEATFTKVAARSRDEQTHMTRYLCQGGRDAYLKRGVVFHYLTTGPNESDSFDYKVDARACASLTRLVEADPATLAKSAQDVSEKLKKILSKERPFVGTILDNVSAHDGAVQVTYKLVGLAFMDHIKREPFKIRGLTQGMTCERFGDAIHRGVVVQVIYQLEEGSPVFDFSVDKSVC